MDYKKEVLKRKKLHLDFVGDSEFDYCIDTMNSNDGNEFYVIFSDNSFILDDEARVFFNEDAIKEELIGIIKDIEVLENDEDITKISVLTWDEEEMDEFINWEEL